METKVTVIHQENFSQQLDKLFSEYEAATHGYLDIAVTGAVSSGKSSFLNAFFGCPKSEPKFPVSAQAGKTEAVELQPIGSHIRILDTPGLQDVDESRSKKTVEFLKKGIDIGILIIEGAANEQQRENYRLLKEATGNVFVVLNKSDQHTKEILQEIKAQWREVLGLDPNTLIYAVSCRGYDFKDKLVDPITREEKEIPVDGYGIPRTILGMQLVRDEVFQLCFKIGKAAFIAKEIKQKQPAALTIIAAACATSVGAVFIPGTVIFIASAQATAISSLVFLYQGKFPSRNEVAKIMKTFSNMGAQGLGAVLYAIFVSFLPPTGFFDIAGIILVVSYMATTLLMINFFLSKGLEIEKNERLMQEFDRINASLRSSITEADFREVRKIEFWKNLLSQVRISI